MIAPSSPYITASIEPDDAQSGFCCGKHPLDDYFARHAVANDREGIGRAYVYRRAEGDDAALPPILGYYTLSMALAHGRGFGEQLLMDALHRAVDAAAILGCIGIIVEVKDADAERFYAQYDCATLSVESWPRRMFLPLRVARAAFTDE